MNITHNQKARRFDLLDEQGERLGEIEYRNSGKNQLCAVHTQVYPGNQGKGYGTLLLDALVAFAEERGATITPLCPYVAAMFKKYPEKYARVIEK